MRLVKQEHTDHVYKMLPPSIQPSRTAGCWAALERRRRIVVVVAIDGTPSNDDDCRESSVKAVVVSCRDMTSSE